MRRDSHAGAHVFATRCRRVAHSTPSTTTTSASPAIAEDLLCILYTSGSTGTPKGVLLPHRAIGSTVTERTSSRSTPGDVIAHASAVTFDVGAFEIWLALDERRAGSSSFRSRNCSNRRSRDGNRGARDRRPLHDARDVSRGCPSRARRPSTASIGFSSAATCSASMPSAGCRRPAVRNASATCGDRPKRRAIPPVPW